ncbi:class I SAM-dependent methyltransferase, partial [Pelagibacterales bacterium]|nr:class I SAM-dependent methyltransferase [Pelagibacterales bacterium]
IDPAKVPANIAKNSGINTIIDFFGSNIEKKILKEYGYADFITSHNVLAHIDDIDDVFKTAFNILKYNGYFTFEVGYFLKVLNNNFFDTIYHEHLDYHHARPLAKYLKTIGFSIVKVSTNNIQGGSIRFMCKKENKPKIYKNVQNFIDKEMNTILYDKKYINNWESEIRLTMKKFKNLVVQKKTVRHKIIGYGAPTKATLLLKMSKINPDVIDYIIEDNILKVSRYLPKTKIKIESNMSLNKDKPDLIIIFSWNFADDIITNIKKIIKKPTDLIVPLPNPRIIKI